LSAGSSDRLVHILRLAGIRDEAVLGAVGAVPRDEFVLSDWRARAYEDTPLPIPHHQVTTQPSLIARMIEGLALQGHERVLEIGTGYGFQTALLARLAREVWSVERFADVAQTARANLARRGIGNAWVVVGDGTLGLAEHGPFDAIVVAAAFTRVPRPLVAQLAAGGRLVAPLGSGGDERVVLFAKDGEELREVALLTHAHFVRLVGRHGFEG
jgi:protein-L-isoaspartate(D-aspartate) O-methyltransferase